MKKDTTTIKQFEVYNEFKTVLKFARLNSVNK